MREERDLSASTQLLARVPPAGYIEEWKKDLAEKREELDTGERESVVIFSLYDSLFCLAAEVIKEVVRARFVHKLPHSKNPYLLGVTNVDGRICSLFSLHKILEVPPSEEEHPIQAHMVLKVGERSVAFGIDRVEKLHLLEKRETSKVPVTVSKSTANYLSAVFSLGAKRVGVLDHELLAATLQRRML